MYAVGRRVLACAAGVAPRLLVTQRGGQRLEAAAARGPLVGFAGVKLLVGPADTELGPLVQVYDLRKHRQVNVGSLWGRATSMTLTSSGGAVTTQRYGRATSVVVALPGGRGQLVLDRAARIDHLHASANTIGWRRAGRRRAETLPTPPRTTIDAPVQTPPGTQPLRLSFVAPVAGLYEASVGADDGNTDPRSEFCQEHVGYARAARAGQPVHVVIATYGYAWCPHQAYTASLSVYVGRHSYPPATCRPDARPCWGEFDAVAVSTIAGN